MKSPGIVATAFLLRRLIKALGAATAQLERIADTEEKRLKLEAFGRNFPLALIDELEPLTKEELEEQGRGRADVSTQTEGELTELDQLEEVYKAMTGRAPSDDEDLLELMKKQNAEEKPR